MPTEENSQPRPPQLERHVQSFLLGILSLVCGWLGLTVQESTVKIAALTERVAYLQNDQVQNRAGLYTSTDAQKDLRLRDEVMSNLAARVLRLETYRERK